jgi:hypothetical protein
MMNKKHLVWIPLFWGSLWGLVEATLGHVLHRIPIPGIAGAVMFPIGVFFMIQAYRNSGKIPVIFLTALVAANIKLIDLFLPARSPLAAINPAIAILCESYIVGLFFMLKDFKKNSSWEEKMCLEFINRHPALHTIPLVVAAIAVELFIF